MNIIEFKEDDFEILESWIKSKSECLIWAGPDMSWPLKKEEITDTSSKKYFLEYDKEKIAYIELVSNKNKRFRLCRILVKQEFRKRSFGEIIIDLAINKSIKDLSIFSFELNVYKDNVVAISCYKKLGFQITSEYEFYENSKEKQSDIKHYLYKMILNKEKIYE